MDQTGQKQPLNAGALPQLVFATHNPGKVAEVQRMLNGVFDVLSLVDIGCLDDIVEDASTLPGNARIKALHVVRHHGLDCFADDTGLEVDALGGAPGVQTARYAGENAGAGANMKKLLHALENTATPDRSARFKTAICLIRNGKELLFEGVCEGHIALQQSGKEGFGYDPIFIPEGLEIPFANMDADAKNAISHRGRAVRAMVKYLLASFD